MSKRLWLILLLILGLALVACAGTEEATTPAEEEAAPPEEEMAPTEEEAAPPEEEAAPAETGVTELKILWAQWDPADYLQEIGNMYEAETGIKVTVVQEPWGSFGDLFFTEMALATTLT
jgi:multiple sugar transport system substrate-binding protein